MAYNFTIIIPHYNIPSLLKRCLESIPQRSDVQVIVVDDCSDNESVSALRILETEFDSVMFIYRKENNGGGKCRNEGMKYAKGKWLMFADADDFFSENASELFDKYKEDDSDIIYFRVDCVLSNDISKRSEIRNYNRDRVDLYLSNGDEKGLRYLHTEPWGKMIRRDLVELNAIQFSETSVCNDYFFSVATGFHAKKIKADGEYLYVLTVRDGSVSSKTDTIEKMKIRIDETVKVKLYLMKNGYELEEKYCAEKIHIRMIVLCKKNIIFAIKEFVYIKKMGLPICPIIKNMLSVFFENRKKSILC